MRELEGMGIVHRSDSDYNSDVVTAIRDARRAKDARALMDFLSGAKPFEYVVKEQKEKDIEEMER